MGTLSWHENRGKTLLEIGAIPTELWHLIRIPVLRPNRKKSPRCGAAELTQVTAAVGRGYGIFERCTDRAATGESLVGQDAQEHHLQGSAFELSFQGFHRFHLVQV